MKCVVVYNPKAGSALSTRELRQHFKKANIEITLLVAIGKNFERHLTAPIKNGEIIAAVGGDGTISTIAGLVAKTNAVLLPLPGGTLNHFTKDLGISQNLDEALAAARRMPKRTIDIASVNDQYFINNSSLGLYPHSLQTRDRLEDTLGKWLAATMGGLRALTKFHHYRLTLNGQAITTPFVFVGNNNYKMNDFAATDRSRLDEGVLYVATVHGSTRWQLVKVFGRMLTGRLRAANDFDTFTTKNEVKIETRRRQLHISRDGELEKLATPIVYTTYPAALQVIAPK